MSNIESAYSQRIKQTNEQTRSTKNLEHTEIKAKNLPLCLLSLRKFYFKVLENIAILAAF